MGVKFESLTTNKILFKIILRFISLPISKTSAKVRKDFGPIIMASYRVTKGEMSISGQGSQSSPCLF